MAAPQQSPMRRRSRLGTELRQLREAAGLTGDQVIERIGWASASKLSRLENGRSRPELKDIVALLDLYGVTGAKRDTLAAITLNSGDMRKWLRTFSKMTERQMAYAELEAGCAEIREYSPVIVPGLLQTDEYAHIRFTSSQPLTKRFPSKKRGVADPDAEVEARLSRQTLLTREDEPPRYSTVLEEAALSCRAGPPDVLRRQIDKLCQLAELPNVTIQVIPGNARITADWYLPHTAFSLYRFPDPRDPEAGSIEGLDSNLAIDDENELKRYKVVFEWLQAAALSAEDTIRWLADAARTRPDGSRRPRSGVPKPPSQRSPRTGRLTEQ
jgi:transcriptional regulator with XRE-family HTH domain